MAPHQWQLALALAAVAANAALAYRLYRRSNRSAAGNGSVDADDGSVVCPDCEAVNESGYRYCRRCVAELPVSMDVATAGTEAPGQVI